jgi:Glycosyltransferase like family
MISIIISSRSHDVLQAIKDNVQKTIGVPFEIISFENKNGTKGLCEVYNLGAAKAKYNLFCFMHEDISFETNDWGKKVIHHLADKNVGLIGLAGGDTKGLVPSSWSSSIFQSEISIIQHYKTRNLPPERILKTGYPDDVSVIKKVVCIDGVWMCTRRDVFEKFRFDSDTFKGFHGYDVDFSLQVFQEYKVCVVFDILVHHYSDGNYNKTWVENIIKISNKWKEQLPKTVRMLDHKELVRQHWTTMGGFLKKLSNLKYPFAVKLKLFLEYSFNRFFHLMHFLHFLKLLIKNDFNKEEQIANS